MEPEAPAQPAVPEAAEPTATPTPEAPAYSLESFPNLARVAAAEDDRKAREVAEYDARTCELVTTQMAVVDQREAEHEELKKETSEAKKSLEREEENLKKLIRERRDARGKPVQKTLLDLIPDPIEPGPPPEVRPDAPPTDPTENLWQQFPVERLAQFGIPEKHLDKLRDGTRKRGRTTHPLLTMGDLAAYTAGGSAGSRQELADYEGIGGQVATLIDDGLEQFWAWWRVRGREEYAREMGVTLVSVDPVQPGAAVAGDGGGDPGPVHVGGGGEPRQPGEGDHGIAHHEAAAAFGFTGGAFVTPDQLAAHQRDRDDGAPFNPAAGIDTFSVPPAEEEAAEPPAGGPDIYDLDAH